jgi:hypothetical protein
MVLAVFCCLAAAVPSSVAEDGLKDVPVSDEIDEGAGLDGDSRWVSPQFGVEAEWDESWRVCPSCTWSRPNIDEDQLRLDWVGDRDGTLFVAVLETGHGSVPEDIEAWSGDDFLSMYDVDDIEVLLADPGSEETDGGVLIVMSDASLPHPVFHFKQSVANEDGLAVYVMVEAPGDVFLDVWEAAERGLTLNGTSFDLQFDVDEIEEAMDSYEAVEYSEEAAGLVGTRQFEGPVCGVSVEWNRSWEISRDLENPIVSDPIEFYDALFLNQVGAGDVGPFLDMQSIGVLEFTDAGRLVDERVRPEAMEAIWGPDIDSEVVLREVRDSDAEAMVAMEIPGVDEPVYTWVHYGWVEATECNAYFRITATASEFEEAWTTVTGDFDIQIAGEPVEYLLTWDDIEEVIEGS